MQKYIGENKNCKKVTFSDDIPIVNHSISSISLPDRTNKFAKVVDSMQFNINKGNNNKLTKAQLCNKSKIRKSSRLTKINECNAQSKVAKKKITDPVNKRLNTNCLKKGKACKKDDYRLDNSIRTCQNLSRFTGSSITIEPCNDYRMNNNDPNCFNKLKSEDCFEDDFPYIEKSAENRYKSVNFNLNSRNQSNTIKRKRSSDTFDYDSDSSSIINIQQEIRKLNDKLDRKVRNKKTHRDYPYRDHIDEEQFLEDCRNNYSNGCNDKQISEDCRNNHTNDNIDEERFSADFQNNFSNGCDNKQFPDDYRNKLVPDDFQNTFSKGCEDKKFSDECRKNYATVCDVKQLEDDYRNNFWKGCENKQFSGDYRNNLSKGYEDKQFSDDYRKNYSTGCDVKQVSNSFQNNFSNGSNDKHLSDNFQNNYSTGCHDQKVSDNCRNSFSNDHNEKREDVNMYNGSRSQNYRNNAQCNGEFGNNIFTNTYESNERSHLSTTDNKYGYPSIKVPSYNACSVIMDECNSDINRKRNDEKKKTCATFSNFFNNIDKSHFNSMNNGNIISKHYANEQFPASFKDTSQYQESFKDESQRSARLQFNLNCPEIYNDSSKYSTKDKDISQCSERYTSQNSTRFKDFTQCPERFKDESDNSNRFQFNLHCPEMCKDTSTRFQDKTKESEKCKDESKCSTKFQFSLQCPEICKDTSQYSTSFKDKAQYPERTKDKSHNSAKFLFNLQCPETYKADSHRQTNRREDSQPRDKCIADHSPNENVHKYTSESYPFPRTADIAIHPENVGKRRATFNTGATERLRCAESAVFYPALENRSQRRMERQFLKSGSSRRSPEKEMYRRDPCSEQIDYKRQRTSDNHACPSTACGQSSQNTEASRWKDKYDRDREYGCSPTDRNHFANDAYECNSPPNKEPHPSVGSNAYSKYVPTACYNAAKQREKNASGSKIFAQDFGFREYVDQCNIRDNISELLKLKKDDRTRCHNWSSNNKEESETAKNE